MKTFSLPPLPTLPTFSLPNLPPLPLLNKKEEFVYLLFNIKEFGKSDDVDYELDYSFRGSYRSEDAALKYFAKIVTEKDESLKSKFFDQNNCILPEAKNKLEEYGWKIIKSIVE